MDLSGYAYDAPPRKRVKVENRVKTDSDTPLVKVEPEDPLVKIEPDEPLVKIEPDEKPVVKGKSKTKGPLAARAKAHPAPAKWREQYAQIKRMREGIEAPVDTM